MLLVPWLNELFDFLPFHSVKYMLKGLVPVESFFSYPRVHKSVESLRGGEKKTFRKRGRASVQRTGNRTS